MLVFGRILTGAILFLELTVQRMIDESEYKRTGFTETLVSFAMATKRKFVLLSTPAHRRAIRRQTKRGRRRFSPHSRSRRGRRAATTPQELKFFDVSFSDAIVATGGTVVDSLNEIPQGVTESTRIGRKCTVHSVYCKFQVTLPEVDAATTPAQKETIRVIIYVDHQCNGATIAVSGASGFLQAADFLSFRELTNGKRFTTLMDRTYAMNYQTSLGTGADGDYAAVSVYDTLFKKVNIPLEFSAAAGAITEIRTNNIGFLAISQTGQGGFLGNLRLRFSDG